MIKFIAIVAGEPNSINSEIIVKAWKKSKYKRNIFVIGNYSLFKKQIDKIGLKVQLLKVKSIDEINDNKKINILDVQLNSKSLFKNKTINTKDYVLKSLMVAHKLACAKKIKGFVNAPVNKLIFNNKYLGVTEYLAAKNNVKNKEIMMIYNKKLCVVPLTTHVEIKNITKKIKKNLIKVKILAFNKSYRNLFNKKPQIVVLGLNPHNSENRKNSIENLIIRPVIKKLKKLGLNIKGPFPADTIFTNRKKLNYNVIIGMYHDQVLAPFKAIYGYDAINVTLGLKYLRVSPDHGTALDITGQNKANPQSLISAINFLNEIDS